MRTKLTVDTFIIQRGRMTVAADQTSVVVADPEIDSTKDVAVVMTPHENVSLSVHKQTADVFLVITSDTADATADYFIASSS